MHLDFFDQEHYRNQLPADQKPVDFVAHFLGVGDRAGLDPSPYFSTAWYKLNYPDWSREGAASAFGDFLQRIGNGECRKPHPLIDPDQYINAYEDLASIGAQAALHFMLHGDGEGRSPSAEFDAAFYGRCYLPQGMRSAFRHYVVEGAARGYLPRPVKRGAVLSRESMQQAVAGLQNPILLCSHDAQKAGVPILTLDLARGIKARGQDVVFLLGNAGPLLAEFRALGPTFITAEGWDIEGLASGLPAGTSAIVNTSVLAALAKTLADIGFDCLLLIHEMADYIHSQGLMPHLRAAKAAGARTIVSLPRIAETLRDDLGGLDHVRPGIIRPETSLASFRLRQRWRGEGPVFISAGHADRRKGFDLFIEAAHLIVKAAPEARFVWLGALDDWAQALADEALRSGLPLDLPGFVSDSLAWYRAADVYLLTSRQDPGPTTVIHAAAVGTPFVGYLADIGLIGLVESFGSFIPSGESTAFVQEALALATGVNAESRRALRSVIRAETDFSAYLDELLSRLPLARGGAA